MQKTGRFNLEVIKGSGWQDVIILVFGKPRTAIYAHIDTIGFSTGYEDELIKIGGPRVQDQVKLIGEDSQGFSGGRNDSA